MSDLPASVKVGCFTYQIITDADEIRRHSDEADIADGAEWSAFSNHDRLLIGINPQCAAGAQRRDLLHELLHCCLRSSGTEPSHYAEVVSEARGRHGGYTVEEHAVAGMTAPLLGVLRDNPDLMAWLTAR